nr:splicing factor SF3a60 homolog [Ipomoea batatas]
MSSTAAGGGTRASHEEDRNGLSSGLIVKDLQTEPATTQGTASTRATAFEMLISTEDKDGAREGWRLQLLEAIRLQLELTTASCCHGLSIPVMSNEQLLRKEHQIEFSGEQDKCDLEEKLNHELRTRMACWFLSLKEQWATGNFATDGRMILRENGSDSMGSVLSIDLDYYSTVEELMEVGPDNAEGGL